MCAFVLQHASNLEQKQNETENKKVHGDVVKYGTVIQVMTHRLYCVIMFNMTLQICSNSGNLACPGQTRSSDAGERPQIQDELAESVSSRQLNPPGSLSWSLRSVTT